MKGSEAKMVVLVYKVKFLTPAFLGDAEQEGRWRTPPFKALLRQWWRVAYAEECRYEVDITKMRRDEGELFGSAWAGEGHEKMFRQSRVRLRLERWSQGQLSGRNWPEFGTVEHPEVHRGGNLLPIGPHLYLGYGPLTCDKNLRRTVLARKAAIKPGEEAILRLAVPAENKALICRTLNLMHLYGTVGGRSRNGWGSFVLELERGETEPVGHLPTREWREALNLDWPHAIGRDEKGPLIWQTKNSYGDWRELMRDLAVLKIDVRTHFKWSGQPAGGPEPRHWLAYPVTNHEVRNWGKQLRLPNSLRFKVRPAPGNPNRLVGVIYHLPCRPPQRFIGHVPDAISQITDLWREVHSFLDKRPTLKERTASSI